MLTIFLFLVMLGDAKLAADFADDMLGNIKLIQLSNDRNDGCLDDSQLV